MADFSMKEKDLCERTLANLDFIKDAKKKKRNVFEVTQLFNSLLGIIVNIKEHTLSENDYFCLRGLYGLKLTPSLKTLWGIPENIESESIGTLVYDMRNSIAHIDLEFLAENKSEITSLEFHFDTKGSTRGSMKFSVNALDTFIRKLCAYIIEHGE